MRQEIYAKEMFESGLTFLIIYFIQNPLKYKPKACPLILFADMDINDEP